MEKAKSEWEKSKFVKKLIKTLREKSLAEFVHVWKNRPEFADNEEMKNLEKDFLKLPDILAYTMNSKFKGSDLDKGQKVLASDEILRILSSHKAIEEYRSFIEYKDSTGSFSNGYEFTALETDLFWAHASNFCGNLAAIGSKLSTLPPATVSILDSSEKFSFLHNAGRHHLSEAQVEKALHVYNTLKFHS